jgi:hypothetical protein
MIIKTRHVTPVVSAEIQSIRNKVLTGVTGEYYVAAELSRRGYIASITLRNTRGVDILCSNTDASKSVGIQVKTRTGMQRSWILSQKGERYYADNLFYAFVNISENLTQYPNFTIVPSKLVADYIRSQHQAWLAGTKKDGLARKDSSMRIFRDEEDHYLGRWDLLGLD